MERVYAGLARVLITPCMPVCMLISLLKHFIYTVYTCECMVLANPGYMHSEQGKFCRWHV